MKVCNPTSRMTFRTLNVEQQGPLARVNAGMRCRSPDHRTASVPGLRLHMQPPSATDEGPIASHIALSPGPSVLQREAPTIDDEILDAAIAELSPELAAVVALLSAQFSSGRRVTLR